MTGCGVGFGIEERLTWSNFPGMGDRMATMLISDDIVSICLRLDVPFFESVYIDTTGL